MPVRDVRSGGRRFRYLEAVARPPARGTLVLIHAFPLSARMWEPQLALADRGWRIVAPQLRGFADGQDDPAASSIDDYAADVLGLMDALEIERAVLGGVSMGGYIAFGVLRRDAARASAIVLADTRPQADSAAAVEGRHRLLKTLAERGPQGVADEMVPLLLGATTRREQPAVVGAVRDLVLANSGAAIAGAINALMIRPDSTPLLAGIGCPVLVLVGEEDEVTPPDVARAMQQAIRGSELAVIPHAGHLSNLEQPAGFNAALAGFLGHRV